MTGKFALIGKDIKHSKSAEVYGKILGAPVDYTLLDYTDKKEIPNLIFLLGTYSRISVTAPYKEEVFARCERVSDDAKALRAVNAVRLKDGVVEGANTDILAFRDILRETFADRASRALILGDGAMARLATYIFRQEALPFEILSRRKGNLQNLSKIIDFGDLVVNCCGRSYSLNFETSKSLIIWDMNYDMPHHEAFADKFNHEYFNGEELLIRQARYALSFWNP